MFLQYLSLLFGFGFRLGLVLVYFHSTSYNVYFVFQQQNLLLENTFLETGAFQVFQPEILLSRF